MSVEREANKYHNANPAGAYGQTEALPVVAVILWTAARGAAWPGDTAAQRWRRPVGFGSEAQDDSC